MMVSFVPAFTAVGFSQFDPTIFNSIDGSKMDAVSADHFHMLFDFARIGHRLTSSEPFAGRAKQWSSNSARPEQNGFADS
jgi:hypothetical protein